MAVMKIGVISDTHGLLRPEAVEALRGCQAILHAGDVGSPEVLVGLNALAPVWVVRGNIEKGEWGESLPVSQAIELAGISIFMLHDLGAIDLDPAAAGFRVVVSGHSHQASLMEQNGVLFFNPGSAGPRRFHLPVSLGILSVEDKQVKPNLILLNAME